MALVDVLGGAMVLVMARWRDATPAWPRRRPEVEKKGIGGER